jgi:putative molybdopterin biosynthesis protein
MKKDYSLTPEEVAEILNIKKNTVYELIKRGELAAFRVGRKLRVYQRRNRTSFQSVGSRPG